MTTALPSLRNSRCGPSAQAQRDGLRDECGDRGDACVDEQARPEEKRVRNAGRHQRVEYLPHHGRHVGRRPPVRRRSRAEFHGASSRPLPGTLPGVVLRGDETCGERDVAGADVVAAPALDAVEQAEFVEATRVAAAGSREQLLGQQPRWARPGRIRRSGCRASPASPARIRPAVPPRCNWWPW